MERQQLLDKTLEKISRLPDFRLKELADYVDLLLKKSEDKDLAKGIQKIASKSSSFHFLEEEEDLYNDSDIIHKYE